MLAPNSQFARGATLRVFNHTQIYLFGFVVLLASLGVVAGRRDEKDYGI